MRLLHPDKSGLAKTVKNEIAEPVQKRKRRNLVPGGDGGTSVCQRQDRWVNDRSEGYLVMAE